MKHLYLNILLLTSFAASGLADITANAPPQTASLTVKIINGTAKGLAVEGDEVTLHIYKNDRLLNSMIQKTDANGKAFFEKVPADSNIVVAATAMHNDMNFSSQFLAVTQPKEGLLLTLQVFDVSNDISKLSVAVHHFIIKCSSNILQITEYLQIDNSSDMAITSAKKDAQNKPIVLDFVIPEGFKNLKFSSYFDENNVVVTNRGFYDVMAVPPGENHISFSYELAINSDTINIVKELTMSTSSFVIFAELGGAKLQGLGQPEEFTNEQNTQMQYYKLSDLSASEKIAFKITGFNIKRSAFTTWIILAGVFAVVIALVISQLFTSKKQD